jgi:hypothetical protein
MVLHLLPIMHCVVSSSMQHLRKRMKKTHNMHCKTSSFLGSGFYIAWSSESISFRSQ